MTKIVLYKMNFFPLDMVSKLCGVRVIWENIEDPWYKKSRDMCMLSRAMCMLSRAMCMLSRAMCMLSRAMCMLSREMMDHQLVINGLMVDML